MSTNHTKKNVSNTLTNIRNKSLKSKSSSSKKSSRSSSSKKSSRSSSSPKPKTLLNILLETLNNDLIKDSEQYNEYNETLSNDFIKTLSKPEKTSINYYQENSSLINGFLRKGYQFLSEFKKETIINNLGKTNFNSAIKGLISKINSIDKSFINIKSPKTTHKTILYRGTDKLYSGINNGYISCSKSIETLFDMNFVKRDRILSSNCCINVLIVDQNIPYIDLEQNSERWKYQKEVLLPRGLNIEIIEESTIKYKEIDFKVYVMRVMINNNENVYKIPELPKDDRVDRKIMNFIIDEQRTEIIKLSNMFKGPDEWSDEIEDINDLIEYIYDLEKISTFTQEQYKNICKKILNTLKKTIPAMMESKIVRDECKPNLRPVLDKVEELLSREEQIITPTDFIEVKSC